MDLRERIIQWHREERGSLIAQIELFSSGKAQFREARNGIMTDTTKETVERLRQRLAELEAFLLEISAP